MALVLDQGHQSLTTNHAADSGYPSPPADMCHKHRDERAHCTNQNKQVEEIPFGVSAAVLKPAHVMHQHQPPQRPPIFHYAYGRHMDSAPRQLQQRGTASFYSAPSIAGYRVGVGLCLVKQTVLTIAKSNRKEPFVLNDPIEIRQEFPFGFTSQKIAQGTLDHAPNEIGPDLQITHEPFQSQGINQGNHGVGETSKD